MAIIEIVGGGDRRSLVKRFMGKSKELAVSELVDIHLTHCMRVERLEKLLAEVLSEVPHGWGASFSESELAGRIRDELSQKDSQ